MLGEGWFTSRALRLQIAVELAGGQSVRCGHGWIVEGTQGPILADSIYDGEVTTRAGNAGLGSRRVSTMRVGSRPVSTIRPKGVLSAEMMPPIRVVDTIMPVKMTSPQPGMYVFDFGQNFSGWTRCACAGRAERASQLRHAELFYDDGTINVENLRARPATDTYILRGDGAEESTSRASLITDSGMWS